MGRRKTSNSVTQGSVSMPTPMGISPSLEEAVKSGLVERVSDRVIVPAKYSPTGKDLVQHYDRLTISARAASPEEMIRAALAMCGGDILAAKKHFNTAFDTAARVPIRHRLVASARRPGKGLRKAAKALVEAGAARSLEEAMARLEATFRISS